MQKHSKMKLFNSRGIILHKIRITQQKLNQNQIYFKLEVENLIGLYVNIGVIIRRDLIVKKNKRF